MQPIVRALSKLRHFVRKHTLGRTIKPSYIPIFLMLFAWKKATYSRKACISFNSLCNSRDHAVPLSCESIAYAMHDMVNQKFPFNIVKIPVKDWSGIELDLLVMIASVWSSARLKTQSKSFSITFQVWNAIPSSLHYLTKPLFKRSYEKY